MEIKRMRNRLREAREARRVSAPELAEKLQVHHSTLTNWEAGRRQIMPDKLVQLADILGFTVDYFTFEYCGIFCVILCRSVL